MVLDLFARHAEATSDIADYIASFYNNVRLHSKLGNFPPNAFEQQSAIGNQTTYQRVRNNLTNTVFRNDKVCD